MSGQTVLWLFFTILGFLGVYKFSSFLAHWSLWGWKARALLIFCDLASMAYFIWCALMLGGTR